MKRDLILASARQLFAQHGFKATSMRMIAADAGCDVALLAYHFGNKQELFVAALDPQGLTDDVRQLLASVDLARVGEAVIRHLVYSWQTPEGTQVLAGIRSLLDNSAEQVTPLGLTVWGILVERLTAEGIDRAHERVELLMATIIGASTLRKFAGNSYLSQVDAEQFIAYFAPILQHFVSADL